MTKLVIPPIPRGSMYVDGVMSREWQDFFRGIWILLKEDISLSDILTAIISGIYETRPPFPKVESRDIVGLPSERSYDRRISELENRLNALVFPVIPKSVYDFGLYQPSIPYININKLAGIEEGAEVNEIEGDGTSGRVLRTMVLGIYDGTDAATLECQTVTFWNGDSDGPTDNVAKGATTGNYTLDGAGVVLTIEAAALSGNCIMAIGMIGLNMSGVAGLTVYVYDGANDINVEMYDENGVAQDMTTLVDTGTVKIMILYLTSA